MPRTITIKTPAVDRKGQTVIAEIQGYVAHLYVGQVQEKFLIQTGGQTDKSGQVHLTHYATGGVIGNISTRRLAYMANMGTYSVPNDRKFAQEMLDEIVAAMGADAVRAKFAQHEILNP